ncbi:hypothetical protein V6C31_10805 [Caldibacillus debilis]|uniref:hypothetical protein n=1 Tax=Caldibacillus debilis TaxID=301148 RepID=UPI002FDA30C0
MPRGRVWAQGMKGRHRPRPQKSGNKWAQWKRGRENLDVRGKDQNTDSSTFVGLRGNLDVRVKVRFDPDRQGNRAMAQMLKGGQKIGGFQPLSALL